jgi:hypothetical protein
MKDYKRALKTRKFELEELKKRLLASAAAPAAEVASAASVACSVPAVQDASLEFKSALHHVFYNNHTYHNGGGDTTSGYSKVTLVPDERAIAMASLMAAGGLSPATYIPYWLYMTKSYATRSASSL